MKSLIRFVKTRPEMATFIVGLALFAGGLASVIGAQLKPPVEPRALAEPTPSPEAKPNRLGPELGEQVAPYVSRKKTLLSQRGANESREPTWAMIVFSAYRKASEVDALVRERGFQLHSIHVRVPVGSFKPREIVTDGRTVMQAAQDERERVQNDLEVLEAIVGDATDENFRTVYQQDLRVHREALGHLGDDPAAVYAVVVKGSNGSMRAAASAAQVRYVDLPDDPTAEPADTVFAPLIPEDTSTATFALQ